MLCFTKFLVAKKFLDKGGGRGREYHDFQSNFFVSVPKNFVGEPFLISEKNWYRNFSCRREGPVSRFSVLRFKF